MGLWGLKNKIWYRTKEYYYSGKEEGKQRDNEKYYSDMVDFVGNRIISGIVIDPSASSFIATIKKYGKFTVKKAKNEVIQGIANTSTAFNDGLFMIDRSCKNIIKELHSYTWDDKAAARGEDKPIKVFDHCCDDMRYFVNTIITKKRLGWN
jgi:PBSX family phage terminase large subunit